MTQRRREDDRTSTTAAPHPCGGCAGVGAAAHDAIDRREFLTYATLAAASAALAACGAGGGGDVPTAPTTVSTQTLRVSDYPALANTGGVALVTIGGSPLAVVRTGATSFVALSRVCPHQGGIVNPVNGGFLCPVHGARFSETGAWTGGQRTSSLRSYPTSFDPATGTLTIG